MNILLNGESYACADGVNIAQLLRQLNLQGERLAVELNEAIVPRSRFHRQTLKDRDKVEIVRAIGGG